MSRKPAEQKSWTGSQTRLITNPIIQIISTERPNPYQSLDFPLLSRPTNAPPQSSTSWHILISAKLSRIECEVYRLHFECHKLRVSPIAPWLRSPRSWGPQSQRLEPRTSPVKHSEWTRTLEHAHASWITTKLEAVRKNLRKQTKNMLNRLNKLNRS